MPTRDTQAVLLLCGRFAPKENVDPLELREFNRLSEILREGSRSPAGLLENPLTDDEWMRAGIEPARAALLLDRRMALGLATERWTNGGLWVISRCDDSYPTRLDQHLGRAAPALLWGVGDLALSESDGVAIVGSRDLDDEASAWTEAFAADAAGEGLVVVSGGARGVDQIAMSAALGAGGRVIAVLAEGLGRPSVVARYREAIEEGRLLLLSTWYPDAGFSVGNAMGRNRVIYGLSSAAVIVRADAHKGGTWAGAEEELRRENAVPLFVRESDPMPDGNRALIGMGAKPVSSWRDGVFRRSSRPGTKRAARASPIGRCPPSLRSSQRRRSRAGKVRSPTSPRALCSTRTWPAKWSTERTVVALLDLPVVSETTNAAGRTVRRVRDTAGTLIEVTLDKAGKIVDTRVLSQASPRQPYPQAAGHGETLRCRPPAGAPSGRGRRPSIVQRADPAILPGRSRQQCGYVGRRCNRDRAVDRVRFRHGATIQRCSSWRSSIATRIDRVAALSWPDAARKERGK